MAPTVRTDAQLERTLGLGAALTIGIGTMIGAGIFVLPGEAAAAAGPAVVISFVLGGVIALLTALSASELATAMPAAGGSYHFINRGLGPVFGAIAGFGNWLGLAFATAFYLIGFGSYLGLILSAVFDPPTFELGLLTVTDAQLGALLAGCVFVAINYLSTKGTGELQNVIVFGLLAILGLFVVLGTVAADVSTLRPLAPEGWDAVLPGTALVFVSYLGFVKITTVAGEIKDPSRNLPRAIVGSVVIVTVLYAVIMAVLLGVVDRAVIDGSETAVADVAGLLTDEYVGMAALGIGLLTFAGLLATASSANASILAASRINYAMGRDGLISEWLHTVHRTYNTPSRAITVTGACILLFVLIGDIGVLARSAAVLHLIVYGLVNVTVIVFRETNGVAYNPSFQVPLYPVLPITGAIGSFALIAFMPRLEILLAVGFVAVSLLWYGGYARTRTIDTSALARYRTPETVEERIAVDTHEGKGG